MQRRTAARINLGLKKVRSFVVSAFWTLLAVWISTWFGFSRRENILVGLAVLPTTLLFSALIAGRPDEPQHAVRRRTRTPPEERVWLDQVSLDEICNSVRGGPGELAYQVNQRRGRYEGKWKRISCVVSDVMIWDDGNGVISAHPAKDKAFPNLSLYFDPEFKDRLTSVNRHDQIEVAGKIQIVGDSHLMVEECEFVRR